MQSRNSICCGSIPVQPKGREGEVGCDGKGEVEKKKQNHLAQSFLEHQANIKALNSKGNLICKTFEKFAR